MATRRQLSFFKVLIRDDFCDQLKVPIAFQRHFDGNVPEHCQLRIRNKTWHVDIELVDNKICFQNGWREFVLQNSLKKFEFLVFSYDGISEFNVHLYRKDACRDECVEISRNHVGNDDTSVEILNDIPPCSRKAGAMQKSSSPRHKPRKKDSTSLGDKAVNEAMYKKPGEFVGEFLGGTSNTERLQHSKREVLDRILIDDDDDNDDGGKDEEIEDDDEFEAESEDEEEEESEGDKREVYDFIDIADMFPRHSKAKTRRKSSGFLKRKRNSFKAKSQRGVAGASGSCGNKITEWKNKGIKDSIAHRRAKDFIRESDKPACPIAISPTYINAAWVHIPGVLANRHLKKHGNPPTRVKLRVNMRSWWISLFYVKRAVRLQTGWTEFARANNLKEGDVCVLVLVDSIQYVFDVTIFRHTEAANCT